MAAILIAAGSYPAVMLTRQRRAWSKLQTLKASLPDTHGENLPICASARTRLERGHWSFHNRARRADRWCTQACLKENKLQGRRIRSWLSRQRPSPPFALPLRLFYVAKKCAGEIFTAMASRA